MTTPNPTTAYAVLRITDFRYFIIARAFIVFGVNMLGTVVAWQIYALTKDVYALGLIGAAEFVPFLLVTLFGGYVADIAERWRIIQWCNVFYGLSAVALYLFSTHLQTTLTAYGALPIYGIIMFTGLVRGFLGPAQQAFMAQLIPKSLYANAATWNTIIWHIGGIGGPALGGLLYAFTGGAASTYAIVAVLTFINVVLLFWIKTRSVPLPKSGREGLFTSVAAGWRFVFSSPILLGAMALDMFAVLFGGAVAMLPAFAETVLSQGAQGLGALRAAPAVGALLMAMILTTQAPTKHTGKILLGAVAGFGVCTILFALSRNFYFSLLMLAGTGFFDNISMVIRGVVMQLNTPDEVRGRVSSVNGLFIGSSNELGAYESGLAARLMGLIPSVVFGGVMTLLVVAVTWWRVPKLRDLDL